MKDAAVAEAAIDLTNVGTLSNAGYNKKSAKTPEFAAVSKKRPSGA
jgi:hypothetical protein